MLQQVIDLQLNVDCSDYWAHLATRPCAPRRRRYGNVPEQLRVACRGDGVARLWS